MDVLSRTPPKADLRLPYGEGPDQFGDLWLPALQRGKRAPVVVFLHGGWWKAEYDLGYAGFLCAALKAAGVAVWSLEYRRVGDGGGWPATMQDVAMGFDHLAKLAEVYPLDLQHVVASGHSAGGHLAFWLAARHHVPESSPLAKPSPKVAMMGVVALAGAVDLRLVIDYAGLFRFSNGKPAVLSLMGGTPNEFPERYHAANPGEMLPLGVPQILVQGSNDDQIAPEIPQRWQQQARKQGDSVEVVIVPGADHFDIVDPETTAWNASRNAILKLLHG